MVGAHATKESLGVVVSDGVVTQKEAFANGLQFR